MKFLWVGPGTIGIAIILYITSQLNDPSDWQRLSAQALSRGDYSGALAAKAAQSEADFGSALWFTVKHYWVALLLGCGISFILYQKVNKKN